MPVRCALLLLALLGLAAPATAGEALRPALLGALQSAPLPSGAVAQRFELRRLPSLSATGSPRMLGELVEVGGGSVATQLPPATPGGAAQRFHLSYRRDLLVVGQRLGAGFGPGDVVPASALRPDSLWVQRPADLEQLCRPGDGCAGGTSRRRLAAGDFLRHGDLRPTPVVTRGERVSWRVGRGAVRVEVVVEARGEGAVGDQIWIRGPFDGRLRRARVLGPGVVGDEQAWRERAGDPAALAATEASR